MESTAASASTSEPSCKRPRVAVRDDDITVLYTPSSEADPIIADVIFVHGLQGHPRKTWQANMDVPAGKRSFLGIRKRKRSECQESSDAMFWPADLLPDDYKNMRILTYGYDSNVSRYFKGPTNKLNLSQLGEGLLNRVVGERRRSEASGRPIVFVAHSLGGLLVEEAIVESKKQGPGSRKIDVYKSTQGIIFFGTPHKGSNDVKWGLILESIASAVFDTNDKLIRALEPDNELLDKLARDFQDIVDEGNLRICSLLESTGKTGLPIFNGKVVPDSSASFGSRKFEHQDYIEKNHMNMCRFAGRDDGGYNRFRDGLEFCVDQWAGVLTENNMRKGLLQSLQYDTMLAREMQLIDANVTTLDWVWLLPTGPSSLSLWLETGTGIFWVQGKPGSGKSTLMSYLKDHSQTKYFAPAHCQDLIIIRFFFDFRARSGISNSFEGLLRAFLFQLTSDIPALSSSIAEFGKIEMWQPKAQQDFLWTTTKLRQALLSALQSCTTNIFMLIDGVDELEGTGRNMLDMIEFFQEVASINNERRHIKVCIASRPHPLMITAFGSSSGFKLQDHNDDGIKNYINCRLKIATQVPHKPAFELGLIGFTGEIRRRSHGVFLWARFAVDEILIGIAEGDEEKELWTRLQALPDELEEIYARIVKRIISCFGSLEETSIMLQIAYFTRRSLRLQEFFRIVQLSLPQRLSDSSLSSEGFEKRILAKTGGLVEVVGTKDVLNGEVRLIHETVRTYLDRQNSGMDVCFGLEKVDIAKEKAQAKDFAPASQTRSRQRSPLRQTVRSNKREGRMDDGILDPSNVLGEDEDRSSFAQLSDPDQFSGPWPDASNIFQPIRWSANRLIPAVANMGNTSENSRKVEPIRTPRIPELQKTFKQLRRSPLGAAEREPTIETRTLKACIRCRMVRIRCIPEPKNPLGSCSRCNERQWKINLPCVRYTIADCLLNRYNCTILDWPEISQHKKRATVARRSTICEKKGSIVCALKKSYGPPLDISIRGLTLDEKVDGPTPEVMSLDALGIQSLEQATLATKVWIDECLHTCIENMLDGADQITMLCFQAAQEAKEHAKARQLITNAMRLWMVARSLQDDWRICSPQVVDHPTHLPPILRYQLETILQLQIFEPLRRKLVRDLQYVIMSTDMQNWSTVFLSTFILLHNCDLEMARYRGSCPIRHAQKIRCPSSDYSSVIENTGNILLAHFYYFCGGYLFFSSDADLHARRLDKASRELIGSLQAIIPEADKKMSKYSIVENYDGKSWFRGQMFVSDWALAPSILTNSREH
ncbi:hypothetical protein V8E51_005297 [Hyaloscypha variabilis]